MTLLITTYLFFYSSKIIFLANLHSGVLLSIPAIRIDVFLLYCFKHQKAADLNVIRAAWYSFLRILSRSVIIIANNMNFAYTWREYPRFKSVPPTSVCLGPPLPLPSGPSAVLPVANCQINRLVHDSLSYPANWHAVKRVLPCRSGGVSEVGLFGGFAHDRCTLHIACRRSGLGTELWSALYRQSAEAIFRITLLRCFRRIH